MKSVRLLVSINFDGQLLVPLSNQRGSPPEPKKVADDRTTSLGVHWIAIAIDRPHHQDDHSEGYQHALLSHQMNAATG